MTVKIISKWINKDIDEAFMLCSEVLKSSRYNAGIKEDSDNYTLYGRTPILRGCRGNIQIKLSKVGKKTKIEIKLYIKGLIDFGITSKELELFANSLDEALK